MFIKTTFEVSKKLKKNYETKKLCIFISWNNKKSLISCQKILMSAELKGVSRDLKICLIFLR